MDWGPERADRLPDKVLRCVAVADRDALGFTEAVEGRADAGRVGDFTVALWAAAPAAVTGFFSTTEDLVADEDKDGLAA